MKYYFVGCSWGKGNKDFFQLMKDRNVVITANKANLLKDYYVAIKRGTKIIAVAKINNDSKHYSDCSFGLTDKELNDYGISISDDPVIAQVSNLVELEHPIEYESQSGSGARIRKEETIKQLDKIVENN